MRKTRARSWALCLALALSVGCYSLSLTHDPKVSSPGTVRAAAGLGFQLDGRAPFPVLGVRLGVVPHTDVRLRLVLGDPRTRKHTLAGLEAGLGISAYAGERANLVLLPQYRHYPGVQEDPNLDTGRGDARRVMAAALPALVALQAPRFRGLFFGPTLHAGTRARHAFLALGGHVGLALPIGKVVRFVPEVSLLGTFYDRVPGSADGALRAGDVRAELGLGFTFGSTAD